MSHRREQARGASAALALVFAFAAGCSGSEQHGEKRDVRTTQPEPQPQPQSPSQPPLQPGKENRMDKNLENSFQRAELVIVARPTRLQPSPKVWSGTLATFQGVEYQVTRVVKGAGIEPTQSIVVLHPLVAKSATADPDVPQLRASAFDTNKTYVVFIRRENGALHCISENDGIVEATAEVAEQLERMATK